MRLNKTVVIGLIVTLVVISMSFAASAQESYDFTMVIYDSTGNPFFQKVVAGANETADLFGVNLDIQYADNSEETQNNILDTAITNEVDGIGLIINLDDAYDETVAEAREAGIPVIAYNIDHTEGAAGNDRMAFIGQDFEEAGYLITKYLIEEYDIGPDDHILAPVEHPEAVYAQGRYAGVRKALDEVGASSELFETGARSPEEVLDRIVQYLLSNPDTDAIVALGQMPMEMTPDAIADMGLDIPNAGFDVSDRIIRNILDGRSLATVDQQPFYQGAFTIKQLYYYNKYGLEPCDINTGGAIIDIDNADAVLEFSDTVR